MAEELEVNGGDGVSDGGTDQNIQTLHALHLDGKGAPTLEDADERSLNDLGDSRPEDVTGNANVQSAGRSTFEQMVQGGIQEERVVPTGDTVVQDTVDPTARDNQVQSLFDNVQPAFTPPPGQPEAETGAEAPQSAPPAFDPLVTEDPPVAPEAAPGDATPAPAAAAAPVAEELPPQEIPPEQTPPTTEPPEEILPRVADAPVVQVGVASGTEDIDTRLTISVATNDQDGGAETISAITISGVPAGFTFVNAAGLAVGTDGGGGTWSFTEADLADLYLRQPGNYAGDLTLTVSATTTENSGDTATTTTPLAVHVEAVADAPTLATHDAAGMEDALIPLSISVTSNDTGNEGPGAVAAEAQTVYIDRLPAGATLVDGSTGQAIVTRLDSALVVDGTTIPAGSYVLDPSQLANLQVRSAANDSADFSLDVWATSTEPSNGSLAVTGFQTIAVDVGIVAPTVSGSASGIEGQWATLSLSGTVNHDLAGDQETLSVYIEGLPAGAEIRFADGSTPTATVVDGVTRYDVTGHLGDTQVRWADGYSDTDMDLTVRGVVHDTDVGTATETALGDATAPDWNQSTASVHVTVQAVADGPSGLSASGIGVEDKWFDLDITTGLMDTDGSEVLTVEVTGPAGFVLADQGDTDHPYAGTLSADGSTVTYTLTQAQLAGLQMRAKADSDADVALTIKATTTETASGDGQIASGTASLTIPLTVTILSDADKPVVSVVKDTQTIAEDALFDLSKSVSGSFSDGTATPHAAVSGGSAEADSVLGAGTSLDGSETITYRITANQDSRLSLDGGATSRTFAAGESVTVSADDIASGKVQLGGVADWASSASAPTLTFRVVTIATEATNDDSLETADLVRETVRESDPAILTIAVDPVADVATARLSVVASGYEDGLSGTANHTAGATGDGIAVTPTLVLTDADHSETPTGLVTLTSTDPAMVGGTVEYNGVTISPTTDGSGVTTWTITGASFATTDNSSFTLSGLVFHPAANSDADPQYDLAVQFQDTNGDTTATVVVEDQTITVAAVADAPTLSTVAAGGWESASGTSDIALAINAALTDSDGSETLTVYVTGIPQGAATLSAYSSVSTADVTVGGVTIAGSADNPVYKLTADQLANLKLQVAEGYSEDMQLTVYAESVEANGGDVAVTGPVSLNVDIGVLAPTVTGADAVSGDEGAYIQLSDLATNRAAADATDTLSVYIEDLPAGATLYKLEGGNYTALSSTSHTDASGVTHSGYDVTALRGADGALSGVYVKWDVAHDATDITFTLRSVVADTDADPTADAGGVDRATPYGQDYNDITETVESVHVTVVADADAPTLSASAIGVEDKWVALTIDPALVDTDGSETLTVTVSGVPSGVTLSAGTMGDTAADGTTTWTFGPVASTDAMRSLLSDLRMAGLAPNSDADFNITVRATATETETGAQVGTATAYTEQVVNVKVLSDADKPVVSVVQDTQTIAEDGLFSLAQSVSGAFNDAADATHAAVTGAAGEAGSVQGAETSLDTSETLTYRITANQDSRISLDGGHTVQSFAAGTTIEVSAADLKNGLVQVGGVADWASSAAAPNLTFSVVAVATESNGAGDDGLESGLPSGLTRETVAVSDPATLTIAVNPVVDLATATLSVSASGYEDGLSGFDHTAGATGDGIPVHVTLGLTDADHSETPTGSLTITSSDPTMLAGTLELTGGTITYADSVVDGVTQRTWTITGGVFTTADDATYSLSGLVFHPQADNADDPVFDLSVQIQDTTSGVTADKVLSGQTITVTAVADQPLVATHDTATVESASVQTIALDIDVTRGADSDGSESLYVYVTDLPAAAGSIVGSNVTTYTSGTVAGLAASADNPVYRVPAGDVDSLRLQISQGYSTDLNLTVYSQSVEQEGDSALSAPASLRVDIGVLDPVISGATALNGNEDARISLSSVRVNVAAADGSETLTVYVEAPSDVTLYNSSNRALTRITFTDADGVSHSGYNVSSLLDANGALNVSAKNSTANDDGNFTLKVFSLVQDVDASTPTATDTAYGEACQDSAWAQSTIDVTVKAVADQPGSFSVVAAGVEDQWVALNLTGVGLSDTDGSETLSVTISGVPAGLALTALGFSGQITQVDATTWTITPPADSLPTDHWLDGVDLRLTGLATLKEDQNFSFPLTVTATATEHGTDGEVARTTFPRTTNLTVTVFGDADTPVVKVLKGASVATAETVGEDGLYNLKDAIKAYSGEDADDYVGHIADAYGWHSTDGSEVLSFRITVADDCVIKVGNTVHELAAGDSLEVSAQDVVAGNVSVGGVANWASLSDSDVLRFDLTPIATESDADADTASLAASNAKAATDLTREASAEGATQSFYLKVTPEADTTLIQVSAAGLEDAAAIAIAPTITLTDADGSESLRNSVDILVKVDGDGDYPGTITFAGSGLVDAGTEVYEGVTYHVYKVPVGQLTDLGDHTSFRLDGLALVPDANSDIDVQYRIRVTSGEAGNDSTYATVSSLTTLTVAAVADAPVLTIGAAGATVGADGVVTVHDVEDGGADGLLSLDLKAVLADTDGSETLTNVELRAVPAGWGVVTVDKDGNAVALSGSDPDGDGLYTFVLNPAIFKAGSGLTVALVPPANSDVDVSGLQLWAKSTETAPMVDGRAATDTQVDTPTAETTLTFDVQLDPVADMPTLMVTNARTNEDTSVALDIRASVNDADETATVTITGVPADGVLSYTSATTGQTVSVTFGAGVTALTCTAAEARSLRFTPPEDASGKFTLEVTATSTDTDPEGLAASRTASRTTSLDVYVRGVNDAILDANGHDITTVGNLTAAGSEDANNNLVNLGLGGYSVDDVDGSETLSAVIQGLPDGVTLVVKTADGVQDTAATLQYIGKDANGDPIWSVPTQYLEDVYVKVPHNYAGGFDLHVRLVTTEADGAATAVDKTLTVSVEAVADMPSISVSAEVDEDGFGAAGIPVAITVRPSDTSPESPEHITAITIDLDLPAGMAAGTLKLQLGTTVVEVGAGTEFTISENSPLWSYYDAATGKLSGVSLLGVPDGWSKDIGLTVTATSQDINGTTATATSLAKVAIAAVPDEPLWALSSGASHDESGWTGATGIGQAVDLGLSATLGDPDGSESVYFIVSGVPDGVVLNHGYDNGDGTWTVLYTPGKPGWTLTATSAHSGQATLTVTPVVVDHDPDGGSALDSFAAKTFTLVVTDAGGDVGTSWPDGSGSGGGPTLSATPVDGTEEEAFSLGGVAASAAGGDSISAIVLNTLPSGATVVGTTDAEGNIIAWYNPVTGGWTIDPAHVADFKVAPPKDLSGSFSLELTAVSVHDGVTTATTSTLAVVTLAPETDGAALSAHVNAGTEDGGAVAFSLTVSDLETQNFSETLADGTITVTIGTVKGADGQPHLPGTLATGTLANGATVAAGSEPGTYVITLTEAQKEAFATGNSHSFTVDGLSFMPADNFSGSVSLSFATAVVDDGQDREVSTGGATITIGAVVDATTFAAGTMAGDEDKGIALNLTIEHQDLSGTGDWGSETASVVISGVPAGAVIVGATNNGPTTVDGVTTYSWTVSRSDLEITADGITLKGVQYVSPPDDSSDVALTFTTYVFEKGGSEPVSTSATYTVTVNGVTDGAVLNPADASGLEDTATAIDLGAQLVDVVGDSEVTFITLSGVPDGCEFRDADGNPVGSAGALDADSGSRSWTFSVAEVEQLRLMVGGKLYVVGPQNVSGSWTLTAQAFTQDTDGGLAQVVASNALPFILTLAAVADAPTVVVGGDANLTQSSVSLDEDGSVSLGLSAALVDVDGSESLSVTITGAPTDTVIRVNTGTEAAPVWQDIHGQDGVWTLSAGTALSLDTLEVVPPDNYNGSFDLSVVATATEQAGGSADSVSKVVHVTVNAVNDAPVTTVVSGGVGIESGVHSTPVTLLQTADSVAFTDVDFADAGAARVLSSMTVSISGGSGLSADDSLALTGLELTLNADGALVVKGTDIQVSYDHASHTLTFNGDTSPEQYAELARHVVFSSVTEAVAAGTREVTFAVTDAAGAVSTGTTTGITVTVAEGALLRGGASGEVAFTATGAPVLAAAAVSTQEDAAPFALDLDLAAAAGVAVVITGMPDGTVLRDADGQVVAADALTAGQLAGLTVDLPDNWNGSATLTVTASAGATVLSEQVMVTATAVNDAPTITADLTSQTVIGNDGVVSDPLYVVPASANVGVADVDDAMVSGMVVRLLPDDDGHYVAGDTLGLYGHDIALNSSCDLVVKGTDIQVSYDQDSHALSFSGAASAATYADLAHSVVLSGTGGSVAAGERSFSVTLYDDDNATSLPLTTSLDLDDGTSTSFALDQDAQGSVYWNGASPVLNGSDADNSFVVSSTGDWSVNGNGGSDTLMLDCQQGNWLFSVDTDGALHATMTDTLGATHDGIIHVDAVSLVNGADHPFAVGDNQVVFNGSADGSIDFADGGHVQFHDLEKIHG